MVDEQIRARGVKDPAVLAAMESVPRESFVPEDYRDRAFADGPLPIGDGQTISQPFIVAWMIERLHLAPGDRVLEIGVGSGYASAVLSRVAGEVFGVELVERLAREAADRLAKLGFGNVRVRQGDGTLGWPEHAPYQGILVSAGAVTIPPALIEQLAPGGRLLIPVGATRSVQMLMRVTREASGELRRETLDPVMFVPLVGAQEPADPSGQAC